MRWLTLNPEPLKFRFRFSDEAAPPLDRLLHAEDRVSSKDPVRPLKVVRGFSFEQQHFPNVLLVYTVDYPKVTVPALSGALPNLYRDEEEP